MEKMSDISNATASDGAAVDIEETVRKEISISLNSALIAIYDLKNG